MLIHEAARPGDLLRLKKVLDRGDDPNVRGEDGATPLHIAACAGHLEAVRMLIGHGADVNFDDHRTFRTPLCQAVRCGHPHVVRYLLEHGADPHGPVVDDMPLQLAVRQGSTEMVRLLLAYGADANARWFRDRTPLHLAAEGGHADIVDLLLNAGADPGAVDGFGDGPWHLASVKGHNGIARRLRAALSHHAATPVVDGPKTPVE